jgi:TPR repeat protein
MAQHKVAFYLERGYGCEKDAKAALGWYEKACAEGKVLF